MPTGNFKRPPGHLKSLDTKTKQPLRGIIIQNYQVFHANQWLVQFLYILGVQFDGELVTGEYGLSGGGEINYRILPNLRMGAGYMSLVRYKASEELRNRF